MSRNVSILDTNDSCDLVSVSRIDRLKSIPIKAIPILNMTGKLLEKTGTLQWLVAIVLKLI
jgi:hypothetical protein